MTIYRFVVLGAPVAKARARYHMGVRGGAFYTPGKTEDAERLVQETFLAEIGHLPDVDDKSHFKLQCWFYTKFATRIDVDNCYKLVADALTGILYKDDSQVWDGEMHRLIDRDHPRTEVTIQTLKN